MRTYWTSKFPWHQHTAGESFFVPALDVGQTLVDGLRVGRHIHGKLALGEPAVYDGLLGVMFSVRQTRRRRGTDD